MCGPAAIPFAIAAAQQIVGGIQGAQTAGANARIARGNAQQERLTAAAEEARIRTRASRVQGSAQANAAASGLDTSGSVLDVLADNAMEAELDALTARYSGDARARYYENQAAMFKSQKRNALFGALVGAGGNAAGAAAAGGAFGGQPSGGGGGGWSSVSNVGFTGAGPYGRTLMGS